MPARSGHAAQARRYHRRALRANARAGLRRMQAGAARCAAAAQ